MEIKDFLTELCQTTRVSGYEHLDGAGEIVKREFASVCDEISTDRAGNIFAVKHGTGGGKKVMFAAHLDEIGAIVSGIDERGLVKLAAVGIKSFVKTWIGQEVTIQTETGEVYGVVGNIPPHMKTTGAATDKAPEIYDIGVDVGYGENIDELKKIVKIGDRAVIKREPFELQNGRFAARALDDAAGIAALLLAARALKDFNHAADVYFTMTTREEIFPRGGAFCAANGVLPDIAVTVDVDDAKVAGSEEFAAFEQGGGAVVGVGPYISRRVSDRLKKTCKDGGITYQVEVSEKSTFTDMDNLQEAGSLCGLVSIPLKYMHSGLEVVSLSDVSAAGRLLAEFVMSLNKEEL